MRSHYLLPTVSGVRATRRLVALFAVLGLVLVTVAVSGGIASASARPHRHMVPGSPPAPGAQVPFARAPAGLRAAVRRTLGRPAIPAAGAFQQGELTASDGAAGDSLAWSVAVSGSTAVVGAPGSNSGAGTAYVFVRSGGCGLSRPS